MDAVEALTRLGRIADASTIGTLVSRRRLRTAVAGGHVVRLARGAYALPTTEAGRAAARLHGARSHLSAAAHCGWEVKWPEARPHVTVPRGRNVAQRLLRVDAGVPGLGHQGQQPLADGVGRIARTHGSGRNNRRFGVARSDTSARKN